MKYMTKEWYNLMLLTSYCDFLKVTRKAEVFSEKYFRKTYAEMENNYLNQRKHFFESFNNIDEWCPEIYREEVKQKAKKMSHEYHEEKEKRMIKSVYSTTLKRLKKNIPQEIQDKVADMRMLALDHCTAEVKKEITGFCAENRKKVDQAIKLYEAEAKKCFKKANRTCLSEVSFHDMTIKSCRKRGGDLVITFDDDCHAPYSKIIFKSCEVSKQETRPSGTIWLCDEIYRVDSGYEIHILLYRNINKLFYFTVRAENVETVE